MNQTELDKRLIELSKEESIEDLMKKDYDKVIDIIDKYTTYDKDYLYSLLDVSPVSVDAIAMSLSVLQYIVSEGGLKGVTYQILPKCFIKN